MQNIGDRIHACCKVAKQGGEGRLVGIFHEPPMEVGAARSRLAAGDGGPQH